MEIHGIDQEQAVLMDHGEIGQIGGILESEVETMANANVVSSDDPEHNFSAQQPTLNVRRSDRTRRRPTMMDSGDWNLRVNKQTAIGPAKVKALHQFFWWTNLNGFLGTTKFLG